MEVLNAGNLRTGYRIQSIDLLRGLVMIIMALDHVRDYFHWSAMFYSPTDLQHTSVPIFFTRWITHFCAPTFVLLSGTAAYFIGVRKSITSLSPFLLKRGIWLIFLELTVINFAWFFNIHFPIFVLATIWALGLGMIVLSPLVYLPKRVILIIALAIIIGHNLLDAVNVPGQDAAAVGWSLLHNSRMFIFSSFTLFVAYPVLPWIALMALGYCLGELYVKFEANKRKKLLLYIGLAVTFLFIILRYINVYGDANHWSKQGIPFFTFLSFLNVTKYPPSLLYILMTIGPAFIFLSLAEGPLNNLGRIISVYGRVPFFYYVLHIYLIHLAAILAAAFTGFGWKKLILDSVPGFLPSLQGYGFHLWIVYIVWIVLVIALYPLCKWYDAYRTSHKHQWWLSYL